MPLTEALRNIHFPTNPDVLRRAQYRLKFEELFYVQLNILRYAKDRQKRYRGYIFEKVGDVFNTFYTKNLPFQLTGAQKRVLKEIRNDVGSGRQMNRLLQGDVGSGKTLVALMSMLLALDNGYQACMMAPTEILANQHYETIKELLFGMDIRVELLTGSIKGKRREAILTGLLTGDVKILIGTHAVIEDTVNFSSLGFVVIDEQHRFGVEQRLALTRLMPDGRRPHLLMLSATPIPRTLAMSYFADIDVSVIDELPPGRTPVATKLVRLDRRDAVLAVVNDTVSKGRQVYWVCPLIEESEMLDLTPASRCAEELAARLPHVRVGLLHGAMSAAEKEAVMSDFAAGRIELLVATTVIEVGVDVPNATLMIIEHAERFGLAQLHQLRGRVGRGGGAAACVLLFDGNLSETGKERLKIIRESNDGFEIARRDLELRGPGEFLGEQQSGMPMLQFADLDSDAELLETASRTADLMLKQYPEQAARHAARWFSAKAELLKA